MKHAYQRIDLTRAAAAILTLLTVLVLGQAGTLILRPYAPEAAGATSSARSLETARTFYESMNRLLSSGDRSIESAVTPGFVEHTQGKPKARSLPEMIDWLLAMRATWPHLQVKVVELEERDQLIAVRLKIDPGAPAPIPGIPLFPVSSYQVLEFLRVEGSGVSDRWVADPQLPVATLNLTADFGWNHPALAMPAIERLSLSPGRSIQLQLERTMILRVESGSVQLNRPGTDLDGIRRPTHEPLDTGNTRILEGKGALTLRNISNDAAEVWVFNSDGSSPDNEPSGDVTNEPAHGLAIAFMPLMLYSDLLGSSPHVSVTRITLPTGTTVLTHTPGIIEVVAVLDGELDATVTLGRALKCTPGSIAQPFDGTETIVAGEGVSAKGTASLGYRVAGPQPATLLIMRIESSPSPLPS